MASELENAVVVDFPLRGEWFAFNSPGDRVPSHGTDMLGQRFAYDFIRVDRRKGWHVHPAGGLRSNLVGFPIRETYAWGQPVHMPFDGVIVDAQDGYPERSRIVPIREIAVVLKNALTFNPSRLRSVIGNFILARSGDTFAAFAHLTTGWVPWGRARRFAAASSGRSATPEFGCPAPALPADGLARRHDRARHPGGLPSARGRARRPLGVCRGRHPVSLRSGAVPRVNRIVRCGVPSVMHRFLLLVTVLAMLTACEPAEPAEGGSIVVVAMAGPVCPVESDPPDPSCAPRPVAGAAVVVTPADGSDDVVAQGETDVDGRLTLAVPVGDYLVSAGEVEGLVAAPEPVVVSVLADLTTEVPVAYDTGIR